MLVLERLVHDFAVFNTASHGNVSLELKSTARKGARIGDRTLLHGDRVRVTLVPNHHQIGQWVEHEGVVIHPVDGSGMDGQRTEM